MKHRRLRLVGGVVATLLVAATPLQADEAQDRLEHFQLWVACRPIWLSVEPLPDDAVKIGLTKEAIATAIRSRLRAARLYGGNIDSISPSQDVNAMLSMQINVASSNVTRGGGFAIIISLYKFVVDPLTTRGPAATWTDGMTGLHSGNGGFILSAVSQLTDSFIDEYLRINDPACSRSPIDPW